MVFHKLGSYFGTEGGDCWAFGIVGPMISLAVGTFENIMVALFPIAGT